MGATVGAAVFYNHATELATLTNTFSVSGTPADPTTISLVITDPSGSETTYTYAASQITKSSTGVYTKDVACSSSVTATSTWQYRWIGTGAAADVVAGSWTTFSTELQRRYCSVEELKSRLGIASTDTADDFEISLAIEAASRQIDNWCDRRFWRGTDTRTYAACGSYLLDVDDLVSVTTLKSDDAGDGTFETTWATSDYQLLPVNPGAAPETRPYTSIRAVGSYAFPTGYALSARDDRVQIVGVFGWPQIPVAVKQAALVLSADGLKMKDAPFGIGGYGDFGPIRIRANPVAAQLLAAYRRRPVLVG